MNEIILVCPWCQQDAAGKHEPGCPVIRAVTQVAWPQRIGWICPKCGAANNPDVVQCPCGESHNGTKTRFLIVQRVM